MHAIKRNLLALAFGAAFVSSAAFSQATPVTGAAGRATADSAQMSSRPTVPSLPSQANAGASDAVSKKTTAREAKPVSSTAAKAAASTATAGQGGMSAQASSPPGKGNWWKDADTDGDDRLSATEAKANAGLSSRFSAIDTDKDGYVTTQEYRAFYTSTASQGEQHAAPQSAVVSRDLWVQLDTDADSRISAAEAAPNVDLNASFAAMDSNDDGFVTQAEYSAYAKIKK